MTKWINEWIVFPYTIVSINKHKTTITCHFRNCCDHDSRDSDKITSWHKIKSNFAKKQQYLYTLKEI